MIKMRDIGLLMIFGGVGFFIFPLPFYYISWAHQEKLKPFDVFFFGCIGAFISILFGFFLVTIQVLNLWYK